MTLEQMKHSEAPYLLPTDVAEVLGCHPQAVRNAARLMPERLGFPTVVIGSRTKIPRVPFLQFMGVQ